MTCTATCGRADRGGRWGRGSERAKWMRRRPAAAATSPSCRGGTRIGRRLGGCSYNVQLARHCAASPHRQAEEEQRNLAEATLRCETLLVISTGSPGRTRVERQQRGRTLQLLEECLARVTGWEWGYLVRLCHMELRRLPGHSDVVISVASSPTASDWPRVPTTTGPAGMHPLSRGSHPARPHLFPSQGGRSPPTANGSSRGAGRRSGASRRRGT